MRSADGRRWHRRALAVAILGVWAVVLAAHIRREYGRSERTRLKEAAVRLSPSATYYAVKLAGAPIGFAASVLDTLPGGFLLTDDVRLFVQALGTTEEARAHTEMELSSKLGLRRFRFTLDSEQGRFEAEGAPDGDSILDVRIRTSGPGGGGAGGSGSGERLRLPIDGPIVLPALLPLRLVLGEEPAVGKTYRFSVFDPSILKPRATELRILGKERLVVPDSAVWSTRQERWHPASFDTVLTWHVAQTFGALTVESWLDPDGRVVRAVSPLGYEMEQTAFEIAWNNLRALAASGRLRAGAPDIVERTAVASNVALSSLARVRRLAVRILDVELEGLDLSGGRQELRGDTLWVERELVTPGALDPGYALPADRARFADALAAEPLVQAGDPAIREMAERIAGGVCDPVEVARRLTEWVYASVEKQVTLSVPSARQVLEARRGDCNEHTVLYVALARALGLPARTAVGLVYARGRFYYHAWPEVWLGRWVAVDPTFGRFPADAAHLRFVLGGLAEQVTLLRLIGRVNLEVVEVSEG